ncbi:MAG: tetratricopeptide (TPR) repeat protein [Kiritimatiellia bacterium]|jgi:tetratricopeptide (TPR) repeat protein
MGTFDRNDDGMDVFIRAEEPLPGQPEPPRRPVGANRSMFSLINAGLLLLILGAAVASTLYVYQPQLSFSQSASDSYPFRASEEYALAYDGVVDIVGSSPLAEDGGGTLVDSQFGSGGAIVHLALSGTGGQTQAWFEWSQKDDTWSISSAAYLKGDERVTIPLGAGSFLSAPDLVAWRAADPKTALGKGQRGLIHGRTFEALRYLNEVVGDEPSNAEALVWRGRAFEAMGNQRKALADYQRVLSFDGKNAAAQGRLDAMRASLPPGSTPPSRPLRIEPVKPVERSSPSSLIPK